MQDGIEGFLFESDAMGKTFLSGCSAEEYFDNFYDEPELELQDLITNFSLIDVPESVKKAIKINESPEVIKEEARINEMDQDDPEYFDLIIDNPDYTQRIDHALADLFDPNSDYWFIEHNLADKVYNELEALKSMGAKVMYFSPPNSYRPFTQPKIDFSRNVSDENEMPF